MKKSNLAFAVMMLAAGLYWANLFWLDFVARNRPRGPVVATGETYAVHNRAVYFVDENEYILSCILDYGSIASVILGLGLIISDRRSA